MYTKSTILTQSNVINILRFLTKGNSRPSTGPVSVPDESAVTDIQRIHFNYLIGMLT